MKKWFLLFSFCLCNLLNADPIQDRHIDIVALAQLTEALGIPQDADIIVETQKWLRKDGQERWDMAELSQEQRLIVLNWALEQGLFAPWTPLYKTYDTALILGATTERMQTRLEFLKTLWDEGVRFNEIVWLTGDRPLDPRVDKLTDRCNNESEAARILWDEACALSIEMRCLPVVFIAVPMKADGKRPNTEDTIVEWLKSKRLPSKALFVSDQPFCGYQFEVIKAILPDSLQFDLVGQGVASINHPSAAAITLDAIARWVYQKSQLKSS